MKKLLLILVSFFAFSGFAMAAVDLNTASKEELDTVKGIGPKKAEAIIEYRKRNGPFRTVDDLKKVPGFGDKSVEKMRSELTVNGGAPAKAEKKPEGRKQEQPGKTAAKKEEQPAKPEAKSKAEKKAEKKAAKAEKKAAKTGKEEKKDTKADKK